MYNESLDSLFGLGWNRIINGWGMVTGAGWDNTTYDLTFKPEGYTPIALMGYSINGINAGNINIYSLSLDTVNKKIDFGAFNSGTSDASNLVIDIQILYVKDFMLMD